MCQLNYYQIFRGLNIVLIFVFIVYSCQAPKSELKLSTDEYDFGIIEQDSIYNGYVVVKNTGNDTLKIRDIRPGCGCTNAFTTKSMILADDSCLLKFSFNTHQKSGLQKNHIYIITNTDSLVYLLQVNAIVRESLKEKENVVY